MLNTHTLDELDTLTTCQGVVAQLMGEVPEGICSTKQLAVLMGYLQTQQQKLLMSASH